MYLCQTLYAFCFYEYINMIVIWDTFYIDKIDFLKII